MSDVLRIIHNVENVCERNHAEVECDFVCKCGGRDFTISHSGRQTKGIFAPYLIKYHNQIVIEAQCAGCGSRIVVFDSSVDGTKKSERREAPEKTFEILNGADAYKIHLMYNYRESNFKTNLFEDCFIEISNSKFKKPLRLYEG